MSFIYKQLNCQHGLTAIIAAHKAETTVETPLTAVLQRLRDGRRRRTC